MSRNKASRRISAVLLLGALAALIALVAWQGFGTVAEAFVTAGWQLAYLGVVFVIALASAAAAWGVLFAPSERPRVHVLLLGRWISFAVNQLLPSAQVGGEIVCIRVVRPFAPSTAGLVAAVLGDKTLQITVVVLHGLVGIALLMGQGVGTDLVAAGLVGSTLLALGVVALYAAQRKGTRAIVDKLTRVLPPAIQQELLEGSEHLDESVRRVYARRGRLAAGLLAQIGFRLGLSLEVWVALRILGYPASYLDAVVIEGVTQMVRSAAFMVPAAIGAQEGAFVLLGAALGIPAPVALSASLFRRAREIALGLPALAAWQFIESSRFLEREPQQGVR